MKSALYIVKTLGGHLDEYWGLGFNQGSTGKSQPNQASDKARDLLRFVQESLGERDAEIAALHNNRHAREDVISGLRDEVEAQAAEIATLNAKLEVTSESKYDGIDSRDVTIQNLSEAVTEKSAAIALLKNELEAARKGSARYRHIKTMSVEQLGTWRTLSSAFGSQDAAIDFAIQSTITNTVTEENTMTNPGPTIPVVRIPTSPSDPLFDSLRFQWLTADHERPGARQSVLDIIDRMRTRTDTATRRDIDIAMSAHGSLWTLEFEEFEQRKSKANPTNPTNPTLEQEIQAKGLTAPRVTPDDLQANIVSAHYFTAAQGAHAAWMNEDRVSDSFNAADITGPLSTLTFCVLVLRNGFTVTGESACASPENFDAEIGRKTARRNAEQKMWPLMGYALKQKLHEVNN